MPLALIFAISLAAPAIIIRTIFWLTTKNISSIHKVILRGYKFHHLHYGLIIAFIGCLVLIFTSYPRYAVAILGVGLGLAADEFIATLLIPEDEPEDTIIYKSTLKQTLYLLLTLLVTIALLVLVVWLC